MSPANYIYLVVQHWHPKDIWTVKGEAFCPVMSFANVNDVNSYMYAYWRHAIEDYKKYMVRSYGPEELENLDFETSKETTEDGMKCLIVDYI